MRLTYLALFLTVAGAAWGQNSDPDETPGQPVARLSSVTTEASIRHGDSGEWGAALRNQPILAGDSLTVARGGRAEIQLDSGHFIRLGGDTEIRLASFDSRRVRVELSRGLITYRILRDTNLEPEISTPSVSVQPIRQSGVRVEVSAEGTTEVSVRRGEADVTSPRGTERAGEGRTIIVRGNPDDPEFQTVTATARDSWDNWNEDRDRYLLGARSTRYVSPDVFGTEDLDGYGRWDNDPAYGDVWTPAVAAGWSPYQNGQWLWREPFGWTWVEDSPWGWAPFHYGSWYQRVGFGWTWYPGRRSDRAWWRPARVAFFGYGDNFGWVPLAPYERYRNGYAGGYRNWQGASAVHRGDFERGNFRNRVPVNRQNLDRAPLTASMPHVSQPGAGGGNRVGPRPRFFSRDGLRDRQSADIQGLRNPAPRVLADSSARDRSDNWKRFGSPRDAQTPQAERRQEPSRTRDSQTSRRDEATGWKRFGSPAAGPGLQERIGSAVRDQQRTPDRTAERDLRYQNRPAFDAPMRRDQPRVPVSEPTERRSFTPRERLQGSREQRDVARPSRSIEVAPPLVRPRESAPVRAERSSGESRRSGGERRDVRGERGGNRRQ